MGAGIWYETNPVLDLDDTRTPPASIRTLASSRMRLLMSFDRIFSVYVSFTLRVNSQRLYLFGQLKNKELFVSSLSAGGSNDVTSVRLVL